MAQARLHVLTRELRGVGLDEEDARELAAELIVHYPLLKTHGGRQLRHCLIERGVNPTEARELVLTLLELLTHRIPYANVLRDLSSHERRVGEARSAAMLGANLLHEIRPPVRSAPPGRRRWLGHAEDTR